MRKTSLVAAAIAVLMTVLALTKDQWMPPSWNRDWHHSWLNSPHFGGDPRQAILEDHRKRVEAIEKEYLPRIDREKELNRELERELNELKQAKGEP